MKNTLAVIISFLILFLVLYISFLTKNVNNIDSITFEEPREGKYVLEVSGNSVSIVKGEETGIGTNIHYINSFDEVLYNGELEINDTQILLKKGVYLINIGELNSKYTIKGEGFIIENDGPSTILVDSQLSRTNIFSQNSIVDLKLVDESSGEIVNDVYLYPHTFIKFTPAQNKNVKGADMLKVTQWFLLDYFGEKILNNGSLNQNFVSKVIGEKNENLENIGNMFLFLKNNSEGIEVLNNLKGGKFSSVIGESLLKRYNDLFLNDTKKVVYYKNLALRGVGDLLNSDDVEDSKIKLIIDTINDIKAIDLKEYENIKSILYYYSNIAVDYYGASDSMKINFSKLYNSLENKEFSFQNKPIISLNSIYSKLDLDDSSDTDKYNGMYKNLSSLLENLNFSEAQKSYLVFLLNKVIISGFNLNVNFETILNLFNKYTEISLAYYQQDDNIFVRTGIAEYSKMIEELLVEVGDFFFLEDRTKEDYLLILNQNNRVSNESQITKLENNIEKIFTFFKNNRNKLLEKDAPYENSFNKSNEVFREYILAIKDYTNYRVEYVEKNKLLLSGSGDEGTDVTTGSKVVTAKDVLEYFEGFSYLGLKNVKISPRNSDYCNYLDEQSDKDTTEAPECYKVENLVINNRINMSFLFTPSDSNRISSIVIDGDPNKNRGSYRLDWEKTSLEDKVNNGTAGVDEEYLFTNFFFYTFLQDDKTTTQVTDDIVDSVCAKDDTDIIKAFKRSLIFPGQGKLNTMLGGFIDVTYCNLYVETIVGSNYKVDVNNAKLTYSQTQSSSSTKYFGSFSSRYLYEEDSFENPSIIFQDDNGFDRMYKNPVIFKGKFKIGEIKNKLKPFFDNYFDVTNSIINSLNYNLQISEFKITYDVTLESLTIENGTLTLKTKKNQISSLVYNKKEFLDNNINYQGLDNILKLIK